MTISGNFDYCLANTLLMAHHPSRYINTIVCKFWFNGKFLFFVIICETHGTLSLHVKKLKFMYCDLFSKSF